MREAVDKRQNRVAVKQQSLTFAGMGHIGQLMGADVQLLGQNLPVTVSIYTKSEFSKMFDTSGLARRSFTFCVMAVGSPPHLRKRFQISME